jgi:hypothetical protein
MYKQARNDSRRCGSSILNEIYINGSEGGEEYEGKDQVKAGRIAAKTQRYGALGSE